MSQIDQFNDDTQDFNIEDFVEDSATPPVTSLGSNKNTAAHSALLSPDVNESLQVFNQVSEELNNEDSSPTAEAIITNARGENLLGYRRAAAELLVDPSATDEWKAAAIGSINDPRNSLYNLRNMVATRAATAPMANENEEAALQRGIGAAAISEVLEFQRKKQAFYNQMQLTQNAEKAATYVNMAEGFIPLTYGYKESRINAALLGDKAEEWRKGWDTVWAGTTAADRRDWFNRLPLEQRQKAMDTVMDVISTNGQTIFLPEEMDSVNFKVFRNTVESGAYTAGDETVDNILGILDVVGVGSLLRTAAKRFGMADKAALQGADDMLRSWERRNTTSDVQPTSPSQTVKDVNPEMARDIHGAVIKDETGDLAAAAYGASREDAIAHDIAPVVGGVDGSVPSKTFHPERNDDFEFMPDADVLDFVGSSGASWLTPSEKRSLRAMVANDFLNATGMVNRKEMTTVSEIPDGVSFKAVFGPTNNGWVDTTEAINQASFALRQYGVTPEDITLLARVGDEYKPIPITEAGKLGNGDYLLQVSTEYKFNTADVERSGFEALDVANNWLDRYLPSSGKLEQGTLQSSLLDPQSTFRPEFTQGATIGGLRGARLENDLLQLATSYVKDVKSLSRSRQDKLFSKIREANAKGESFNYTNLKAEGFTTKEVSALEKWKKAQDTIYSISNRDLVKTYRARGYGLMEHTESGTRLIVKPVSRNQVGDSVKAYDPLTSSVVELDSAKLTQLYKDNGQIAKTNSPMQVDGMHVDYVLNRNAVGTTYIRSLKETDTVLNYRKGYYAVRYKNPHFIERKIADASGKPVLNSAGQEQWKAVATAANIPDAKRGVERMTITTGAEHRYRNDLRGEEFETASTSVLQSGGMSAQRLRGQRLEEASGFNMLSEVTHIESPIESLIHSMQSLGARVTARDWIETAKARFVAQYGDVLPVSQGRVLYPGTRGDIGRGNKISKQAADARTTWEYIRQMENGYVNSIDDGWKALFNGVADYMGHKGWGKGEEGLRAIGGAGPSSVAKGVAFSLLLATNPLRQLLVQSHQMLMLGSVFPRYTFSKLPTDLLLMMTHHLGVDPAPALLKSVGRTLEESRAMFNALKESNIGVGISKHELVRESLGSIADEASKARLRAGMLRNITKPFSAAATISRKAGFDFGEYLSSSASFLAYYNDALGKGVKMDKAGIETITAKSRNFVYNMDRAGAMPYNHNSIAVITQFLQVPHKAVLQFTFNRGLNRAEKNKILTYTLMMFGTTALTGVIPGAGNIIEEYTRELLPEDSLYREAVLSGLETVFLNKIMTSMYGEPVGIDYSSLAPAETYGVSEFIHNAFTEGPLELFANSPSGSLVMGTNPRISKLMNSLAIMTGLKDNFEDNPVKWSNVGMDTANLFSGLSNAFKAQYALEYGRKMGALGGISDSNVNTVEAIAAALGLPTQDETKYRKAMEAVYKGGESIEKDVKKIFAVASSQLAQDGMDATTYEYVISMSGRAMSIFKGNPKALEIWNAEMRKQQASKDTKVLDKVLEFCSWGKEADVKRLVDSVPNLSADRKAGLKAICDYNLETRRDLKDN